MNETSAILDFSKQIGLSVDVIFLSSYLYALKCVFNCDDIIVGLVVNNRIEKVNSDKKLGLFLNTIPLRCRLTKKILRINELVQYINQCKNSWLNK